MVNAIGSFENAVEQVSGYAIPFSLKKQQNFEEGHEFFDYYGEKI